MGFWKRQKSKILIGGTLLAIASGALGILKSEEARLKREIVGCERVIERETRDGGLPKASEKRHAVEQAFKQRETLREQQEEIRVGEEELTKLIENIEFLELEFSEERKDKWPHSWAAVNFEEAKKNFDMGKEALAFFSRFSDE